MTSSRLLPRLLTNLAPTGLAFGCGNVDAGAVDPGAIDEVTKEVIFERAECGRGLILGRAAAVVLRTDPRALHVRLDGAREARLRQAMRIQGIDRETADGRMKETDHARYAYVRLLHRVDARDPSLYHLIIDSTRLDLVSCVEIIAAAAECHGPAAAAVGGPGSQATSETRPQARRRLTGSGAA